MPNPQKTIKRHWAMCAYFVANTLAEVTDINPATYTLRLTVLEKYFEKI